MTIEIKNNKAKKLLEDLEELDLLRIVDSKKTENLLDWLDEKKISHAESILNACKEASLAKDGKIELQTLDEVLRAI